jgi:hypothetical protein
MSITKKKKSSKLRKKVERKSKIYFSKPQNDYPTLYLGADISINHCGLVLLDDNNDNKFKSAAITSLTKPSSEYSNIFKLNTDNCKKPQLGFRLCRTYEIQSLYEQIFDYLFCEHKNYNLELYMEGYAYGAKGTVFEIAEISQTFKMFAYDWCQKNKVHNFGLYTVPPMTLKKFITGNGHAIKDDIKNELYQKYKLDLSYYDCELKGSDISEDMNDAFALTKFGSEFNKWQLGKVCEYNYSDYFSSLKEETILGFRR